MASKKTPEQRLDAMSAWAFGEDGKSGITADIKALQDRILPTAEECDAISAELGALYDKYATVRDDAREVRNSLGEIEDELRQIDAKDGPLAVMSAQASLDAFGINEVTKKPYTVKQTADRATVALGANEEYKAIKARKRKLEGDQARAKAVLADCDAALSEYRNRNRALVAQLDNLTARMSE